MKNKSKILSFLITMLLLVTFLIGCKGPQSIKKATLRDTIFSIENRANGAIVMWMTHDDVGTYCTLDTEIVSNAREALMNGSDVLVDYRTLNVDDPENGALGGLFLGACNTDSANQSIINYLVTGLKIAPPRK